MDTDVVSTMLQLKLLRVKSHGMREDISNHRVIDSVPAVVVEHLNRRSYTLRRSVVREGIQRNRNGLTPNTHRR